MCNSHYELLSSVDELLKVRTQSQLLKQTIAKSREAIRQDTETLVAKAEHKMRQRHYQLNLLTARTTLDECLPVLRLYQEAERRIHDDGNFHRALRVLDALEQLLRHGRRAEYTFSGELRSRIPRLRAKIKMLVLKDLKVCVWRAFLYFVYIMYRIMYWGYRRCSATIAHDKDVMSL